MADSNIKIVVSAEDNATPALDKIRKAFDQYQKSYETISQFNTRQQQEATALSVAHTNLAAATDQVSTSNRQLFTTFTAASLAAGAIGKIISFASSQFKESVSAANEYQSAIAGLSSYAATFGESTSQATSAVQKLSSDGLLPSVNAANALKNLLASGLNLNEASTLVKTFEDRAAFGRNQTIGFGTAVENLSQAFKTEQSRAGDANGMTENFSQILAVGAAQMGKNVDQLSTLERAHAKLIGIQQLSIATEGDAARYAETAAGQQAKLEFQVKQTQLPLGRLSSQPFK